MKIRSREKVVWSWLAVSLTVLLCTILYAAWILVEDNPDGILINEVCSWNETVIKDPDGDYSDYIELYNASQDRISLDDWYLSDDEHLLQKCRLEGVLEPGGYLVLYADGKGEASDTIAFKISSEGERIFLVDAWGNVADSVYVPKMDDNTAYARIQDGEDTWARMDPSPGAANNRSTILRERVLDPPAFSHASGFYEEPFLLEMEAYEGKIYYTTDGSVPTETSDVYESGIWLEEAGSWPNRYNSVRNVVEEWKDYTPSGKLVDKAVVIRAVVMDDRMNTSDVVTQTYFVGLDGYAEADVLAITADPEDLFGEDGIYVTGGAYDAWYLSDSGEEEKPVPNFLQKGREWEIEGNVQLFESGQEVLNQPAGLRIQGSNSRTWDKKRFSLYARKEYGESTYFEHELFGRKAHSLVVGPWFLDELLFSLTGDRDVAARPAKPVTVFLDGEFWYEEWIQEKYNKYYLQERYGVDPEQVVIIKDGEFKEGEDGYEDLYEEFLDWVSGHDLSSPEAYEELSEWIDIQSYIDFLCINIYLSNLDMGEDWNYMLWRTADDEGTEYGDGRWRWMLYDLDIVLSLDPENYGVSRILEVPFFTQEPFTELFDPWKLHTLLSALRENAAFKEQFVLSFMDMVNTNFAPEQAEKYLEELGADLSWNDRFFAERADYIVPNVAEAFELSGTLKELRLGISDADAGTVKVNTCTPDLTGGDWTGRYYTDYPVTLQAAAKEGCRFAGWQKDGEIIREETITVDLQDGDTYIMALFEKE